MSRRRRLPALPLFAVAGLALSACATPIGPGSDVSVTLAPLPPSGEVVAQGTIMDVEGDVELCLGAIMESYPPQCHGIPLDGWTWDGVDGSESSGDVTWGAYAVQGTFDGETFTLTQPPILLALYDPMALPDPTGGVPGATDEETLAGVQQDVEQWLGSDILVSTPHDGYVWVDVVWDDGALQQAVDDAFGKDVVIIRSVLREP